MNIVSLIGLAIIAENNPELENEYHSNVEVKELPEFNTTGKETYRKLEKTAKYVLRALALHLELEETYFDEFLEKDQL